MPPYLLRLAYVALFLLAMLTVWTVWSQVGGQGHLDLMPWYAKLLLSVSLSWVTVMGTAAAVSQKQVWNRTVIVYVVLGLLLTAAMGTLTYYYHMHEADMDNEEPLDTTALLLSVPGMSAMSANAGLGGHK
ncbi:MAG: hypothetical protein ABL995_13600 [Bryobacteraceae bacterium]